MFKTLKSKILAIAITFMAVIISVFTVYAYIFEINTKPLVLDYYSRYIEVLKDEINDDIIKIENNSKGLALIGSLFYKTDKSVELTREVIKKIFYNYPDSLGGGIWFEPYIIDKAQKRFCFYAFRDKNGEIIIDDSFNSEKYDYLRITAKNNNQLVKRNTDLVYSKKYAKSNSLDTISNGISLAKDLENEVGLFSNLLNDK